MRKSVKALRDALGPAGAVAVNPGRFSISARLDAFDVDMRHFHGLPDTAKADTEAVLQVAAL